MKSPPEEFSDDRIPLGYLITIRAYGYLNNEVRALLGTV
jgi:hypothetical protein